MAMLAEPRRKQRVGPNPRGKFFIEDSNNKGRHLLMKMGWKHGDGLGVERQGMTEPIIPKIHTDNRGLGFDVKSDPWVAHTDDFEAILQNLKTANGIVDKEDDDEAKMEVEDEDLERPAFGFGFGVQKKEEKSNVNEKYKSKLANISLEAHSKSSRNRIHYQKFVKNKDLSKIKAHDWNCIFGKSVIAEVVQETPLSSSLCSGKDVEGSKRKRRKVEEVPEVENGNLHDVEPDEKTKKKKKKRKRQEEDVMEESSETPLHDDVEADTADISEVKKERKKKKKKSKKGMDDNDELVASSLVTGCQEEDSVENNAGESEDIQKKKKKRKKDKEIEVNDVGESKEIIEDETPNGITEKKSKKKKKDKNKEEIASVDINVVGDIEAQIELPVSVVVETCAVTVTDTASEHSTEILIPVETLSAETTSETTAVMRKPKVKPDAEEIHTAAVQFKGSNILQIPGYRNQSNKPVPL